MDLLDIGGGFPGSDDAELKFEEVSRNFIPVSFHKPKNKTAFVNVATSAFVLVFTCRFPC